MYSGRRRLACRPCTERKVKCDKESPCGNCVKRGHVEICGREPPHSRLSQGVEDASEVTRLRQRLVELETQLQHSPSTVRHSSPPVRPNPETPRDQARETPTPDEDSNSDLAIQDAATVLEFLAWGRMKDPVTTIASDRWEGQGPDLNATSGVDVESERTKDQLSWLQMLLPSQKQIKALASYHAECILWFHGSYFAPIFQKQLRRFLIDHHGRIDEHGVNLQWIALLFAVLAETLACAPNSKLQQWRFSDDEAAVLCRKWCEATTKCLNLADYTTKQAIYSVQAIATLTGTAHLLGRSNSQSVMLASAVRIAQNLGLHRLDADARGNDIDLETGRRLWAQLCTQDWFSISFSESFLVSPLQSISLPPRNCHDQDMKDLPESTPTQTSYCRFLTEIASIMPRLQESLAAQNTLYTKYEQVLRFDRIMRRLASSERPSFLTNVPLEANWPCWVPWARRAIALTSAHKIIMIHRKFLGASFTNPAFKITRETCLAASRTILTEFTALTADASDDSPTFWTYQAFSIAACIVICLDILCRQPQNIAEDRSYRSVLSTIDSLKRNSRKSMIANRGINLLQALQKNIDDLGVQQLRGQKRAAPDDPGSGRARKRRHSTFDVSGFIRAFNGAPSRSHTPHHDSQVESDEQGIHTTPVPGLDETTQLIDDELLPMTDLGAFQLADISRIWDSGVLPMDNMFSFEDTDFLEIPGL